jgi:recombination protein RecT
MQLVKIDDRANAIKQVFALNRDRMLRLVPRTAGDPNRLLSIAFTAIAYDDKLVTCDPATLFGGVIESLKLGLTIGGPMQECWLIPFWNSKRKVSEAVMIVGYQGYRNLLDRAKATLDLHPRAVFANDEFDVEYGTNPRIHHRPHWMLGRPEPGEFIAAYAVARLRGGGLQLEVMPKYEIDEHRAQSRAKDSGPWVTHYVPMALKTVVRKIAKYLPKTSWELARAMDLDTRADLGQDQQLSLEASDLDLSPLAQPVEARPSRRLDEVTKMLAQRQEGEPAEPAAEPAAEPVPEPAAEPAGAPKPRAGKPAKASHLPLE